MGVTLPTIAASKPTRMVFFVWRAKLWMNRGKKKLPGEQAVVSHCKQDTRLPQQHHQHDAGKSRESPDRDYVRRRVQSAIQESYGNGPPQY